MQESDKREDILLRWKESKRVIVFLSAVLSTLLIGSAVANPVLGNVAAGNVSIQQTPSTTTINQTSHQAILNWQSFNIGQQEATHFQQPAGGIALNRISPTQGASSIYGQLTATGTIILMNPAGVFFGPSAYVNVGGLIATTGNITDQNFLNGNYQFSKVPGYSGSIINQGQIIAANHGLVALMAEGVVNNGMIQANMGHVILASGDAYTLSFSGDDLINFNVTAKTSSPGLDQNGKPLRSGVTNTGTILADGGKILITADAAQGVLDSAIDMEGVVQAQSVSQHKGEIILDGHAGTVVVSGTLDASGRQAGQTGGTVKVLGDQVALVDKAVIDVSGDQGGGEVLIGGNAHGAGPEQNATYTYFGSNANVYADALTSGNGGKVVVWSNDGTQFYGNIFARGGATGGNGGWVETSGEAYLNASGMVNASAPLGAAGSWLLDPRNVTITNATANGSFNGGNPDVFTPTADDATVDVATIDAALNGGTSVTINTGASGAQAGDITLSSAILKSLGVTTPTLTLTAAGSIVLNNTISATSGALNVLMTAAGGITENSSMSTGTGNITLNTGSGNTLAFAAGSQLLSTGTINLTSDKMTFGASAQIGGTGTGTGAAATVILQPTTAGTTIGVDPVSGVQTLVIPSADIFGTNIRIGNSTAGTITMGTGFVPANFAANGVLTLDSAGAINIDTSPIGTIFANNQALLFRDASSVDFVAIGMSGLAANVNGPITSNIAATQLSAYSVTLGSLTDDLGTVNGITTPSGVQIGGDGASTITVTQNITSNGDMILDGTNFTVANGVTLNSGSGVIEIIGENAPIQLNASTLKTTGTNGVLIETASTVALGNVDLTGGATLAVGTDPPNAVTGNVTQNPGTSIIAGAYAMNSGGSIDLNSPTNAIAAIGGIRGSFLTLNDTGPLTINNPITGGTITNPITITTTGQLAINANISTSGANNIVLNAAGVTQNAGTTVDAGSGTITVNAGGGAINFNTGNMTTTNASAAAVTIQNGSTLALGNITAASGTVVLGAGDITGAITQNAGSAISANNITANTTSSINLNSATNSIPNLGAITNNGSFTLNDTGALTVTGPFSASTNPISLTTTGNLFMPAITGGFNLTLSSAGTTLNGNLNVASLSLAGGGTDTINASTIITSGNQIYNDALALTTDTAFSGAALTLGAISGADNLNLTASAGTTLNGAVTNLTSLTLSGGSTDTINTNTITTTGNQTYNDALTLGVNTALTGSTINITNGVNGNKNLSMNGVNLNLNGGLTLNNVTATGTGVNNSFTLNTGSTQNWSITGANGGSLNAIPGVAGAFNFTNIENITGGNNGNMFVFANNASVSGTINGGSLSSTNTLSYVPYTTSVNANTLSNNLFSGTIVNSANTVITTYSNINQLFGNHANVNILTLPSGKTNVVTNTGPLQGFVNDPLFFDGFIIVGGATVTPTSTISSASTFFDVSPIIQQPDVNAASDGMIDMIPAWVYSNNIVTYNMNLLVYQSIRSYNDYLGQIGIDLNCGNVASP